MGYRDNTWYGKNFQFERDNGLNKESLNPAFNWPSGRVKYLEALSALRGENQSVILKRGYIRGLDIASSNSTLRELFKQKCRFQFNPQEIMQTVAMNADMYISILQDPGQFAQPVHALAEFRFDLVFDRTDELFSRSVEGQYYGPTKGHPDSYSADLTNPQPHDVVDIGVLTDLRALYSVIGQGFSNELINEQADLLMKGASGSGEVTGTKEVDTELTLEEVRNMVEVNVGNAAFLAPHPVRVVFSSLFMVDGFVTGTRVDFLKFNPSMVPMAARVGITMQAVYIGFAKEQTLLTQSVTLAQQQLDEEEQQNAATVTSYRSFGTRMLRKFMFCWGNNSQHYYIDSGGEVLNSLYKFTLDRWQSNVNGNYGSDLAPLLIRETGNNSIESHDVDDITHLSITLGEPVNISPYMMRNQNLVLGFDNFSLVEWEALKKEYPSTTVTYKWTWTASGPFSEAEAVSLREKMSSPSPTQADIDTWNENIKGGYSGSLNSNLSSPSQKNKWVKSDWPWYMSSYIDNKLQNQNGWGFPYIEFREEPTLLLESYYLHQMDLEVTISDGTNTVTSKGEVWTVDKGQGMSPKGTINLKWGTLYG